MSTEKLPRVISMFRLWFAMYILFDLGSAPAQSAGGRWAVHGKERFVGEKGVSHIWPNSSRSQGMAVWFA